jgi:hypothetical protein
MSALIGAFGSLIGYLGSEVAEVSVFERLLWPHRFYYDSSLSVLLKQALLMTMGGPLHAAALATLDNLRHHGLYVGIRRGDVLGTAFLPDVHVPNFCRTESREKDLPKGSRNGFWVRVLRNINEAPESTAIRTVDLEAKTEDIPRFRSMQLIRHLALRVVEDTEIPGPEIVYISALLLLNIFLSELSATATAVLAGTVFRTWWLIGYMSVPLIFKLLAVCFTVRREGLEPRDKLTDQNSLADITIYEIQDPNQGFSLIKGPAPVIQQFFRHYGHPIRDSTTCFLSDRTREVLCIMLIYGFVLYFPAGLIGVLWMSPNVQYLWLSYQLYSILVMHIVRVLGWQGCGRTEDRVARHLERNREVWLQCTASCTVAATLVVESIRGQAEGKSRVQSIVNSVRQESQDPIMKHSSPVASGDQPG